MRKKIKLDSLDITLAVVLVLMLICLVGTVYLPGKYMQATLPIPFHQTLTGEYSYNGEDWKQLTKESKLSALDGDLYLCGHFDYAIEEGTVFRCYKNHIGMAIKINDEEWYCDEVAATALYNLPEISASTCGTKWEYLLMPTITEADKVEIFLHNPHQYGNKNAYRQFLDTMCITAADGEQILERNLGKETNLARNTGSLLISSAILLLGVAVSSLTMRIFVRRKRLILSALIMLFLGIFFIFDTIDIAFSSELVALNTYLWLVSMMMLVLCADVYITEGLTGKRQMLARAAVLISGIVICIFLMVSILGNRLIYDALPYWALLQLVLCPILFVCCIMELAQKQKKNLLLPLSGILLIGAFLFDILGIDGNIYSTGSCSKTILLFLLVVHVIAVTKGVWLNYQDSIRVKELERELEDSRISIMLSQMQPHFLFNVLNSINQLYDIEPKLAKEATMDFADYLRCNMLAIEKVEPIAFSEELNHIRTYLSLEQMRFGEKLKIVYDLKTTNFKLPALTIQPLVENAVKHGLTKKRGGGTLIVSTRETATDIVITVEDTGKGFDVENYMSDGKEHIGIRNVQHRLENMMNGTLQIDSTIEVGTIAVVTLPKKEI